MENEKLYWTDEISVCCGKIDRQHRELFDSINELMEEKAELDPEEFARILTELTDYFKLHFAAEEQYMAQIGFPGLKQHRAEHLRFTYDIAMFNQQFTNKVPTQAKALNAYMKDWFLNHVQKADMSYKAFLEQKQLAEKVPSGE